MRGVGSIMNIDATTFRTIATRLLPPGESLSADEATAIVHAAQLAGGVDLDEDADEVGLVRQLSGHVCTFAGISPADVPVVSPLPIDDEERRAWIARLASMLPAQGARELAYVISYLVTVVDLELDPIESTFVEDLRVAFCILRERARDLAITVSSMITPGVEAIANDQPAMRHR
jgi:hypothetical protein